MGLLFFGSSISLALDTSSIFFTWPQMDQSESSNPKLLPRSPEVTGQCDRKSIKKHTWVRSKSCFLFNLISKGTYLHAGHRRRPRNAAPKKQSWVAKANRCEWSTCLWSNEWLTRKRKLVEWPYYIRDVCDVLVTSHPWTVGYIDAKKILEEPILANDKII